MEPVLLLGESLFFSSHLLWTNERQIAAACLAWKARLEGQTKVSAVELQRADAWGKRPSPVYWGHSAKSSVSRLRFSSQLPINWKRVTFWVTVGRICTSYACEAFAVCRRHRWPAVSCSALWSYKQEPVRPAEAFKGEANQYYSGYIFFL